MKYTEHPEKPRSASCRSGLFCTELMNFTHRWIIIPCLLMVLLEACGPSSPRFTRGTSRKKAAVERSSSVRFASREAEEETKENDRKPEPAVIESVVSGARDFKKEKNRAITPLEQSRMMRAISRYMGTPYVYGGNDIKGIDCSAYTSAVYKESIGKLLPRSAHEQATVGTPVSFKDLKFGDLVFFNTTGKSASHVGIYLGDDLFAHASVSLGVTISSLESSYYKKRYEGARRLVTIPKE